MKKVISAGLDNSVIVWNVKSLSKEGEFRHVHKGGSLRALILPSGIIATSGADNLIKEFKTAH